MAAQTASPKEAAEYQKLTNVVNDIFNGNAIKTKGFLGFELSKNVKDVFSNPPETVRTSRPDPYSYIRSALMPAQGNLMRVDSDSGIPAYYAVQPDKNVRGIPNSDNPEIENLKSIMSEIEN